tara:strand:+ start:650 stop:973 length:324 start_codon:yes stop_codon:yes gene_type:complete
MPIDFEAAFFSRPPKKKKKKIDYEALNSPLSRIPGLDLPTVRDLLDLGIRHTHELRGRSPESLFDDIQKERKNIPADRLWHLRLAVYFSENDEPDRSLLQAWKWKDS